MTITKMVWIITEYVHRKKQFCAHFCGLPFFGSICRARMRAPMKRMHSIGAMFTVCLAWLKELLSCPRLVVEALNSSSVFTTATPR